MAFIFLLACAFIIIGIIRAFTEFLGMLSGSDKSWHHFMNLLRLGGLFLVLFLLLSGYDPLHDPFTDILAAGSISLVLLGVFTSIVYIHDKTQNLAEDFSAVIQEEGLEYADELFSESFYGRTAEIKKILEQGCNVNANDKLGQTAAMIAAANDNEPSLALIIEHGANLNQRDLNGETALMKAIAAHSYSCAALLVYSDADIDAADSQGKDALNYCEQHNMYEIRCMLIDNGAQIYDSVLSENQLARIQMGELWHPLLNAINEGDIAKADMLLAQGDNIDEQNENGYTGLIIASAQKNEDMIRFLIEKGADINKTDIRGETALIKAVRYGYADIAEMLLAAGADITGADNIGKTPLSWAAHLNRMEILRMLLDYGAEADNTEFFDFASYKTPLMWAAYMGNLESADILIKHGASVNAENHAGKTAMHYAGQRKHSAVCDLLLHSGAIPVDLSKYDALFIAKRRGVYKNREMEQLITGDLCISLHSAAYYDNIVQAKRASKEMIDVKNNRGMTPLMIAASKGNWQICEYLLEKKAQVNFYDIHGETALMKACREGFGEIVQLLTVHGAAVDMIDKYGKTALCWAAYKNRYDICSFLIKQGADIDKTLMNRSNDDDVIFKTPLMWAAFMGNTDIVKLLLSSGANPRCATIFGKTAAYYAQKRRHFHIKKIIETVHESYSPECSNEQVYGTNTL